MLFQRHTWYSCKDYVSMFIFFLGLSSADWQAGSCRSWRLCCLFRSRLVILLQSIIREKSWMHLICIQYFFYIRCKHYIVAMYILCCNQSVYQNYNEHFNWLNYVWYYTSWKCLQACRKIILVCQSVNSWRLIFLSSCLGSPARFFFGQTNQGQKKKCLVSRKPTYPPLLPSTLDFFCHNLHSVRIANLRCVSQAPFWLHSIVSVQGQHDKKMYVPRLTVLVFAEMLRYYRWLYQIQKSILQYSTCNYSFLSPKSTNQ